MLVLKIMSKVSEKKHGLHSTSVQLTARNGYTVRLGNFANKLKITISLQLVPTKKAQDYKNVFTRELCENGILKGF